jgi:putative hydrolase of the HAD superfamily
MIKTILFDVDGVLVVGEPWSKNLAQTHGITPEMLKPFFREAFQACLVGKADLKDALAPYLARWGWQQSAKAFLNYWFRQEQVIDEKLIQAVQQLRQSGIKCCLATQQERYRTEYILHEMGFADLFDGMFSSVDVGYMKNDPLFFETILHTLDGHQAEEVLFWDDTLNNVTTAQSVGIQAEVYSDFDNFMLKMQKYKTE